MSLRLENSIDVKDVLAQMPEVAQIWETELGQPPLRSSIAPTLENDESDSRHCFILKLADQATQLEFPL